MRTVILNRQWIIWVFLTLTFENAQAALHTVLIEGMKFVPETLTIARNDQVQWINKDFLPHTVTHGKKNFDSKEIPAGATWSMSFSQTGTFRYLCTMHPTMKGRIHVKSK